MTAKKSVSIRLTQENETKLNRILELRNADQNLQHLTELNRTDVINEAISFYYAYVVDSEGDIRINKLYETELKAVMKTYMKPIYSMFNSINFQQKVVTKELNYLFNELNQWPNEAELREKYGQLFSLDRLIQTAEKKLQKQQKDIDEENE